MRIDPAAFDSTDCATVGCPNEAERDGLCRYCRRVREETTVGNGICKIEGCAHVAPVVGRYAGYCLEHRARAARVAPKPKPGRALAAVPGPPPEVGLAVAGGADADPAYTIAEEAAAVVKDRMASYGEPIDNHSATAGHWTEYLRRRGLLAAGAVVDAEDVCWLNVLQKISRQAHVRKHDNRVDVIGFGINAVLVDRALEHAE